MKRYENEMFIKRQENSCGTLLTIFGSGSHYAEKNLDPEIVALVLMAS